MLVANDEREELARAIEKLLAALTEAVHGGDDARVKELDADLQRLEKKTQARHVGPVGPHWASAPSIF